MCFLRLFSGCVHFFQNHIFLTTKRLAFLFGVLLVLSPTAWAQKASECDWFDWSCNWKDVGSSASSFWKDVDKAASSLMCSAGMSSNWCEEDKKTTLSEVVAYKLLFKRSEDDKLEFSLSVTGNSTEAVNYQLCPLGHMDYDLSLCQSMIKTTESEYTATYTLTSNEDYLTFAVLLGGNKYREIASATYTKKVKFDNAKLDDIEELPNGIDITKPVYLFKVTLDQSYDFKEKFSLFYYDKYGKYDDKDKLEYHFSCQEQVCILFVQREKNESAFFTALWGNEKIGNVLNQASVVKFNAHTFAIDNSKSEDGKVRFNVILKDEQDQADSRQSSDLESNLGLFVTQVGIGGDIALNLQKPAKLSAGFTCEQFSCKADSSLGEYPHMQIEAQLDGQAIGQKIDYQSQSPHKNLRSTDATLTVLENTEITRGGKIHFELKLKGVLGYLAPQDVIPLLSLYKNGIGNKNKVDAPVIHDQKSNSYKISYVRQPGDEDNEDADFYIKLGEMLLGNRAPVRFSSVDASQSTVSWSGGKDKSLLHSSSDQPYEMKAGQSIYIEVDLKDESGQSYNSSADYSKELILVQETPLPNGQSSVYEFKERVHDDYAKVYMQFTGGNLKYDRYHSPTQTGRHTFVVKLQGQTIGKLYVNVNAAEPHAKSSEFRLGNHTDDGELRFSLMPKDRFGNPVVISDLNNLCLVRFSKGGLTPRVSKRADDHLAMETKDDNSIELRYTEKHQAIGQYAVMFKSNCTGDSGKAVIDLTTDLTQIVTVSLSDSGHIQPFQFSSKWLVRSSPQHDSHLYYESVWSEDSKTWVVTYDNGDANQVIIVAIAGYEGVDLGFEQPHFAITKPSPEEEFHNEMGGYIRQNHNAAEVLRHFDNLQVIEGELGFTDGQTKNIKSILNQSNIDTRKNNKRQQLYQALNSVRTKPAASYQDIFFKSHCTYLNTYKEPLSLAKSDRKQCIYTLDYKEDHRLIISLVDADDDGNKIITASTVKRIISNISIINPISIITLRNFLDAITSQPDGEFNIDNLEEDFARDSNDTHFTYYFDVTKKLSPFTPKLPTPTDQDNRFSSYSSEDRKQAICAKFDDYENFEDFSFIYKVVDVIRDLDLEKSKKVCQDNLIYRPEDIKEIGLSVNRANPLSPESLLNITILASMPFIESLVNLDLDLGESYARSVVVADKAIYRNKEIELLANHKDIIKKYYHRSLDRGIEVETNIADLPFKLKTISEYINTLTQEGKDMLRGIHITMEQNGELKIVPKIKSRSTTRTYSNQELGRPIEYEIEDKANILGSLSPFDIIKKSIKSLKKGDREELQKIRITTSGDGQLEVWATLKNKSTKIDFDPFEGRGGSGGVGSSAGHGGSGGGGYGGGGYGGHKPLLNTKADIDDFIINVINAIPQIRQQVLEQAHKKLRISVQHAIGGTGNLIAKVGQVSYVIPVPEKYFSQLLLRELYAQRLFTQSAGDFEVDMPDFSQIEADYTDNFQMMGLLESQGWEDNGEVMKKGSDLIVFMDKKQLDRIADLLKTLPSGGNLTVYLNEDNHHWTVLNIRKGENGKVTYQYANSLPQADAKNADIEKIVKQAASESGLKYAGRQEFKIQAGHTQDYARCTNECGVYAMNYGQSMRQGKTQSEADPVTIDKLSKEIRQQVQGSQSADQLTGGKGREGGGQKEQKQPQGSSLVDDGNNKEETEEQISITSYYNHALGRYIKVETNIGDLAVNADIINKSIDRLAPEEKQALQGIRITMNEGDNQLEVWATLTDQSKRIDLNHFEQLLEKYKKNKEIITRCSLRSRWHDQKKSIYDDQAQSEEPCKYSKNSDLSSLFMTIYSFDEFKGLAMLREMFHSDNPQDIDDALAILDGIFDTLFLSGNSDYYSSETFKSVFDSLISNKMPYTTEEPAGPFGIRGLNPIFLEFELRNKIAKILIDRASDKVKKSPSWATTMKARTVRDILLGVEHNPLVMRKKEVTPWNQLIAKVIRSTVLGMLQPQMYGFDLDKPGSAGGYVVYDIKTGKGFREPQVVTLKIKGNDNGDGTFKGFIDKVSTSLEEQLGKYYKIDLSNKREPFSPLMPYSSKANEGDECDLYQFSISLRDDQARVLKQLTDLSAAYLKSGSDSDFTHVYRLIQESYPEDISLLYLWAQIRGKGDKERYWTRLGREIFSKFDDSLLEKISQELVKGLSSEKVLEKTFFMFMLDELRDGLIEERKEPADNGMKTLLEALSILLRGWEHHKLENAFIKENIDNLVDMDLAIFYLDSYLELATNRLIDIDKDLINKIMKSWLAIKEQLDSNNLNDAVRDWLLYTYSQLHLLLELLDNPPSVPYSAIFTLDSMRVTLLSKWSSQMPPPGTSSKVYRAYRLQLEKLIDERLTDERAKELQDQIRNSEDGEADKLMDLIEGLKLMLEKGFNDVEEVIKQLQEPSSDLAWVKTVESKLAKILFAAENIDSNDNGIEPPNTINTNQEGNAEQDSQEDGDTLKDDGGNASSQIQGYRSINNNYSPQVGDRLTFDSSNQRMTLLRGNDPLQIYSYNRNDQLQLAGYRLQGQGPGAILATGVQYVVEDPNADQIISSSLVDNLYTLP